MAKYKAYPEYKDSEHNFVRTIPKHWGKSTVGAISSVIDPQPDHRAPVICDDGSGYPYIGIRDVNKDGTLNFETARPVEESAVIKQEKNFIIRPHDIIFCKVGTLGLPRKIIPNGRCALSATLVLIKADETINSQFLLYTLDSDIVVSQTNYLATGSTRAALGIQQIRKFQIPIPSSVEQQQIAVFLDYETAKIDNLIEKQQQLIELLKEKRQAVISHAVTKGLNPDVPMKDSGVDWLGEVPEHWTIAQLKFNTLEMQTGPFGSQLHAEDYVIDGIPLINPAHMNAGMIIPDPKVTVDEATQERLGRHKLSEGEIILSRRGELGRCAVVKKNNEGWLCGTGSLKAKLTKKIIPDYAYTLISSEGVVSELTLESKGSTMANLNTETLGRVRLPIPPISEQEAILDYIKIISDKYDYLIRSADTAIRLMQERRTALISAAVTGKIDVRDWVAPDTQDVEEPQEATA